MRKILALLALLVAAVPAQAQWATGTQAPGLPLGGGTLTGPLAITPGTITYSGAGSLSNNTSLYDYTANVGGTCSGACRVNLFQVNSYNVNQTGGSGSNTRVYTNFGGSNLHGGFLNFDSTLFINQSTGNTSNTFYQSGNFVADTVVNDGGVLGTPSGSLFALGIYSRLRTGASYWVENSLVEGDITAQAGTNYKYSYGYKMVLEGSNAVAPDIEQIAFNVGAAGGALPTVTCVLCVANYSSLNPLASTATLLGYSRNAGTGSYPQATIAYGIDLFYFDPTVAAWRGPNGTSLIDDLGNFTGTTFNVAQPSLTINGDMAIDQAHEGAATSSGVAGLTVDRWRWATNAGENWSFQRVADAPTGYLYSLKATNAAAVAPPATGQGFLQQLIEGSQIANLNFGGANASSIVFDFLAKCSSAGTFSASLNNSGSTRSYVVSYTLANANTWTAFSYVVPGDTTGSWGNTPGVGGVLVTFDLGSGTNFQTTANAWQAGNFRTTAAATELSSIANVTCNFTAVHLRAGTKASPYLARPYPQELALAERFYRKTFPSGTAPAQNAGVAGAFCVRNPIAAGDPSGYLFAGADMYQAPTITTYNPSAANANWRDVTAAADVTVSVDPATAAGKNGALIATSGTVATLGDMLCLHAVLDTGV